MTRTELIAALEQATGPSRELDLHIWASLYAPTAEIRQSQFNGEWCAYKAGQEKLHEVRHAPKYLCYTGSTDAAFTVPPVGWAAILYTENNTVELYETKIKKIQGVKFRSGGATLAIALCIVSLKART